MEHKIENLYITGIKYETVKLQANETSVTAQKTLLHTMMFLTLFHYPCKKKKYLKKN